MLANSTLKSENPTSLLSRKFRFVKPNPRQSKKVDEMPKQEEDEELTGRDVSSINSFEDASTMDTSEIGVYSLLNLDNFITKA